MDWMLSCVHKCCIRSSLLESALEATCTRYDEELDDYDQELQLAVQEFETAQAKLNALESEQADADAIEKAREESKQASTSMEAHMAKRAEKAAEYDKVKAEAAKALHDAQCDAIRKSGTPAQQQKLDEMAPTAAEASPMPSSASASSAAVSVSVVRGIAGQPRRPDHPYRRQILAAGYQNRRQRHRHQCPGRPLRHGLHGARHRRTSIQARA